MFTVLKVWLALAAIPILLKLGGFIDLEWAWVTAIIWAPTLFIEGVIILWVISLSLYERLVYRRVRVFSDTEREG